MAERELPYNQFNFLVDLGTGDTDSVQAGFQEVSGLGMEINMAEYRAGNETENGVRKVPGTYKVPDVTFKRGLIGTVDLFEWVTKARQGSPEKRTIIITLQSEDRSTTAAVWTLKEAFPIKYTGPSLNGTGTDVAVEELVVACEIIEMGE